MSRTCQRDYIDCSFGQLHYRYCGADTSPVLLLLHQAPSHSQMFEALMQELASDFRCIAPDYPGFGQSDALNETISVQGLASSIDELLQLLGLADIQLLGHHTGTAVALELQRISKAQLGKLYLSGPTLLSPELAAALPAMGSPFPAQADGQHLLSMWQRIAAKDASVSLAVVQRDVLSAVTMGACYQQTYQAVADYDFSAALHSVTAPCLVFAGSEDVLQSSVQPTVQILQQAGCEHVEAGEIAGAKTYVCETHCQQVAEMIRQFNAEEAS